MADYANGVAAELGLDIRFQAVVLRQMVGATRLGRTAAEAYARRKGVAVEQFLAGFGKPLELREYGEHVATLLSDSQYRDAGAVSIRGDTGIQLLSTGS